jgi:hypothetical protein
VTKERALIGQRWLGAEAGVGEPSAFAAGRSTLLSPRLAVSTALVVRAVWRCLSAVFYQEFNPPCCRPDGTAGML